MMRYAPGETNIEKKKMYFFKKGLNSRLKIALSGHTCHTLREMINKMLKMERDRLEVDALHKEKKEKKRQAESSSHTLSSQRPRGPTPPQFCSRSAQGAAPAPSHGGGTYSTNYHRPAQSRPAQSPSSSTWKAPASTTIGSVPFACFTYGQLGHKAAHCLSRVTSPPTQTPAR
jgi:hypothetical protein